MKNIITLLLLIAAANGAKSQVNLLRYNDNFSYLKADSVYKTGTDKLKYIPLSAGSTISFGGEIREQLQYFRNINFGDVPHTFKTATTWQLWQRLMMHTNIEAGSKFRFFAQLGSTHRFINPNPLTPEIDQNNLNVQQLFADCKPAPGWMIRIGRQELSYGNHRLITFREGPNTRLAFDGAVIKYLTGKRKIDILALSPVIANKGVFDDEAFTDRIVGVYGTETAIAKKTGLDYYFLHYSSSRRQYNFISGKENRQITGLRFFSERPHTNYELEATYQFGKFNNLHIKAYSITVDISRKIFTLKNAVAGIAGNFVTGDRNGEDGQLNTYNLLFSKPQYGLTAPVGATNIITLIPYIKLSPVKKTTVYAAANFMWRQSSMDGTYSPGAIETRPLPQLVFASDKKRMGTLFIIESACLLNSHFSLAADASYFLAGNYVKATGKGKDITYLSLKANYKF